MLSIELATAKGLSSSDRKKKLRNEGRVTRGAPGNGLRTACLLLKRVARAERMATFKHEFEPLSTVKKNLEYLYLKF
jgi:hypothetical protein